MVLSAHKPSLAYLPPLQVKNADAKSDWANTLIQSVYLFEKLHCNVRPIIWIQPPAGCSQSHARIGMLIRSV